MASSSRLTSLLRRRGQGRGDELPTMNDDGEKYSMKLGRRRDRLSLVKYLLAFGGAVLMIFHQLISKGMIPRLRVMTRTAGAASSGMQQYDAVIVGAGWAGISAAKALLEDGVENILVLEANDYIGGR